MPYRLFCTVLFLSAQLAASEATDFVRVDPADRRRLIDANGEPVIVRGVMLESWLHLQPIIFGGGLSGSETGFYDRLAALLGEEAVSDFRRRLIAEFLTQADLRRMRHLGFNTVRIAINHIALDQYDDGWAALDQAIAWCAAEDLYVIIDLHTTPSPPNNSATVGDYQFPEPLLFDAGGKVDETVALWRRIAERYHDETRVLAYDLVNEPATEQALFPVIGLQEVYRRITAAIRAVDPHHLLIYEGDEFAKDLSVFDRRLDDNAALSFHTYNWFGEDLTSQLQSYEAKGAELAMPVLNTEFGGNTDAWVETARRAMESDSYRFSGWVFWTWKAVARSGGDWFGIPHEDIHYLREFTVAAEWQRLVDHLSQEPSAPVPSATEARAAIEGFFERIALDATTEYRPIVEALIDHRRRIAVSVEPAPADLSVNLNDDQVQPASDGRAVFDRLPDSREHRIAFITPPVADQ